MLLVGNVSSIITLKKISTLLIETELVNSTNSINKKIKERRGSVEVSMICQNIKLKFYQKFSFEMMK